MKKILTIILLFLSVTSFGQNLDIDNLWRTKGVYDSLGNFMERAKIQSFLYTNEAGQLERIITQDKMNMETGETKVSIYLDTLSLEPVQGIPLEGKVQEVVTVHSKDSLTVGFNGYHIVYVRLNLPKKKVKAKKLKKTLINNTMIESIENESTYQLTYQDNGLVKVSPIDSESSWESDYKLIDFNGFYIIQGIVSAPKLILKPRKKEIDFLEIDYRFENKTGILKKAD